MKTMAQYFSMVLFTMLCMKVLTFESVNHSMKSKRMTIQMKAAGQCFTLLLLVVLCNGTKFTLKFESVNKVFLKCSHWNERYRTVSSSAGDVCLSCTR